MPPCGAAGLLTLFGVSDGASIPPKFHCRDQHMSVQSKVERRVSGPSDHFSGDQVDHDARYSHPYHILICVKSVTQAALGKVVENWRFWKFRVSTARLPNLPASCSIAVKCAHAVFPHQASLTMFTIRLSGVPKIEEDPRHPVIAFAHG